MVAVINLARRCGYFYWTFGKILKEDTVMVFGNNSQVTAKEMDFPSGWQFIFAAQGVWKYAGSKSGFCQGWLNWDCEQSNHELHAEERLLLCVCYVSSNLMLCLWGFDISESCSFSKFSAFTNSFIQHSTHLNLSWTPCQSGIKAVFIVQHDVLIRRL